MKRRNEAQSIANVARLLAVVVIVGVLYFARDIFIPLALGILLSFLLSPIVNRLQRMGVSNTLSVVATATATFIVLAAGLTVLGQQLSEFVYELPQYKEELKTKARSLAFATSGVGELGNLASEVKEAIKEADEENAEGRAGEGGQATESRLQLLVERIFPVEEEPGPDEPHDGKTPDSPLYVQTVGEELPLGTWAATAGTLLGPLTSVGLVTVFALFMLIYRESLRDRIIAVVSHGKYVTTTEALDEVAHRISRYIIAQTVINSSYGFVLTTGLILIGKTMTPDGAFPNALLWGVMASCLRFVPYAGPVAGAMFPLAISLAVFPGYGVFLAVLGFILLLELISNNIIEPWLYGASTGISAIAVITAAVCWGWLWGPVGLILSTPLTVCLVVLGRHVPGFRFINTLLGEDIQIKPSLKFYQRLLAGDRHRAKEVLNAMIVEKGPDAACDQMLIPALKRLRADNDSEDLTDERFEALVEMVAGLANEVCWIHDDPAEQAPPPEQRTSDKLEAEPPEVDGCRHDNAHPLSEANSKVVPQKQARPLVLGVSAHHPSENILLSILQIVGRDRWDMELLSEDDMPTEIGSAIAEQDPAVAVIMVLPRGGFAQARFLCRIIRGQGYRGPIVVACMGKFKHADRISVRFRKAGANHLTTSFLQTRLKMQGYAKPAVPSPTSPTRGRIQNAVVDVPVV